MIARTRLLLAALALFVSAGAASWTVRACSPSPVAFADTRPPGHWNVHVPPVRERQADEDARTLSLPYLSGRFRATGRDTGVVAQDPGRTWGGWNLIVSGHAPEVVLMDMDGNAVHRWRMTFERAFPGKRPTEDAHYFRRARLLPGGDLLAIYQGSGMVRLDRDSELVWRFDAGFYNDVRLGPDGNIYSLTKRARQMPEINPDEAVLEDSLVVLSPDGELLREVSLLAAMRRSRFAGLLSKMADSGDVLHSNTVVPFDGSLSSHSPLFARGNVMFSLRHVDVIGILDLRSGEVLWASTGPWHKQHEPVLLPTGRLLLFDNEGSEHARVLELKVTEPEAEVVSEYGGPEGAPLVSPQAGVVQPLPNGNLLIVASESGRAIEITAERDVVWEFRTPHRAGKRNELVATLFDVLRLPADAAPWLQADADPSASARPARGQ